MLVNAIVFALLYVGLLLPGLEAIDTLTLRLDARIEAFVETSLPPWLSFLSGLAEAIDILLRLGSIVGLFLLVGILLSLFGTILGAPWYGQLAEKIERMRLGSAFVPPQEGIGAMFRDIWRAIAYEVKKLVFALGASIFLLLLNVVPVLGTIAASFGGLIVGSILVGLDFFDPALERRRLRFRDKLKVWFSHLPASGTFSFVCLFLVSVPLLNIVTTPICVAAGTLFFCDRIWHEEFAATDPM